MDILLVDDEEVVFQSIGKFLHRCGHSVRTASDGAEALRRMEESTPDVVVSDIRMPGVDGLELLASCRLRYPNAPVILITGHGDVDTAVSALQKGAYDYIRKPVKLKELIAILERIEDRRELERTLVQERAKLAHAGRLATVGTLAAGIAHEINNPTTMIRGNLQTFQRVWELLEPACRKAWRNEVDGGAAELVEEVPGLIAGMLTGTDRITRIVNQVKQFSRAGENGLPELVDLDRCVDQAAGLTSAGRNGIRLEVGAVVGRVLGVEQELVQVFVNLLHNAGQAVGDRAGGWIQVGGKADSVGWLDVSISDNGDGIPEALRDKVFDTFFTTKEPGEGTGLGLSICHSIVTEHGGHLGFEPRREGGTRFWVRFPLAVEVPAPVAELVAR